MSRLITLLMCLVCLSMVAIARDLTGPSLEIKGTKIGSKTEAKRVASDSYFRKMQLNVSAMEGVQDISIIKLGFDITDFATKGEKLWEARVMTLEGKLRAIIWINPKTEKIHFVIGPWKTKEFMQVDENKIVSMKNENDFQTTWDELEKRVKENSELWKSIQQIYFQDGQNPLPTSMRVAVQKLYRMVQEPSYCQMLWIRFFSAQQRRRFAGCLDLFISPASEARFKPVVRLASAGG